MPLVVQTGTQTAVFERWLQLRTSDRREEDANLEADVVRRDGLESVA